MSGKPGRCHTLLAHFHGQLWNSSEAAQTLNVDYKTVQRYVDLMTSAFLLRVVPAYFKNTGKRLRRAHRLYLRDSGLLRSRNLPPPPNPSALDGVRRAAAP